MKRRLEDALQDCLAALEADRATVEECLARYPDLAADLKPLLSMGRRLQEVFDVEPSPLYAEAARQRFLAALSSRRQRALTRTLVGRPRLSPWRWAPAALGSAALVTFALWASILALGGSGDGSGVSPDGRGVAFNPLPPTAEATPTPEPQPVVRQIAQPAKEHLETIREAVKQGSPVEPAVIQDLRKANEELAASLDSPEVVSDEDLSYIDDLLKEQEDLLSGLGDLVAPEASEDVEQTITIAGKVRIKIDERRAPTSTVTPEASPTPEGTSTATPEATETPTPSPTSEAPPEETSEPLPTPEAVDEATGEATPEPPAAP